MARNKSKERFMANPIEQHDTAAWANVDSMKDISNVTMPSEMQITHAKEHVDANQK